MCWLLAYPIAGQIGARSGMAAAFLALAAVARIGAVLAIVRWPVADQDDLAHGHPELPENHPHLTGHDRGEHRHPYVIDDLHSRWPDKG